MNPRLLFPVGWLLLLLLSGCAHRPQSEYGYGQVGVQLEVQPGIVQRLRTVTLEGGTTGSGAAAGAAAGAIVGGGLGDGYGSGAAIVAGSILGAILGDAAERSASTVPADELTVLLGDDRTIVVVQPRQGPPFQPGDAVEVLTAPDGTSRVRHVLER
jgi:outer membrane lipoprotein SlyB